MLHRSCIPVSLPQGVVDDIEALVASGKFSSKSEALRFGAKLLVMIENERLVLAKK